MERKYVVNGDAIVNDKAVEQQHPENTEKKPEEKQQEEKSE